MTTLKVELRMNHRRFNAISQEAYARIRRAPKGERGRLMDMYAKRVVAECIYMSTSKKPLNRHKPRV